MAFFSDMSRTAAHRHVPDQYESQQGQRGEILVVPLYSRNSPIRCRINGGTAVPAFPPSFREMEVRKHEYSRPSSRKSAPVRGADFRCQVAAGSLLAAGSEACWTEVHGYGPPLDLLTWLDANKSALVSNPVLQSVGGVSDPGAHRGGQTEDPGLALVHQLPHAGHHTPRGGTGSRRLSCSLFLCRRHTR